MENTQNNDAKSGCGCSGSSCGSCWAKVAIGLWLFLVGALGGFAIGHCCASHRYHAMMSCPIAMPAATPPAK
jgi:hypothetical protein